MSQVEAQLPEPREPFEVPRHVAIIMDGNGRWAAQRHLPRVEGHRAGIDSVRDVVETSARLGIGVLTLYAFSMENWKRPKAEVTMLMMLLKRYIRSELGTLLRHNIRFRVIGRTDDLAPDVQKELEIIAARIPDAPKPLSVQIATFVQALRKEDLWKVPGTLRS